MYLEIDIFGKGSNKLSETQMDYHSLPRSAMKCFTGNNDKLSSNQRTVSKFACIATCRAEPRRSWRRPYASTCWWGTRWPSPPRWCPGPQRRWPRRGGQRRSSSSEIQPLIWCGREGRGGRDGKREGEKKRMLDISVRIQYVVHVICWKVNGLNRRPIYEVLQRSSYYVLVLVRIRIMLRITNHFLTNFKRSRKNQFIWVMIQFI